MANEAPPPDSSKHSRQEASTQPPGEALSSSQTLGGTRSDWGYRFLRFHLPLAVLSGLLLVAFMTLPLFDATAYPHADIFSSPLPQSRAEGGGPMDHGTGQNSATEHGESEAAPPPEPTAGAGQAEHGRRSRPMDHGRGESPVVEHGRPGTLTQGGDEADAEHAMDGMQGRSFTRRMTVATGYLATALLALTLLIGPANLLFRKRNPISSYLRRDAGTWTAVASVVHVIYGLQVHGSGSLSGFLSYFIAPNGSPWLNSFGLGNWTGLAATVIVVGLLAISSDLALRKLRAKRWKNLQRLNYALFILVIAHAFFYGALLRLESPYTLLLLLIALAVFLGQAAGVWLWRRRQTSRTGRST